jgi:hypothetical protein
MDIPAVHAPGTPFYARNLPAYEGNGAESRSTGSSGEAPSRILTPMGVRTWSSPRMGPPPASFTTPQANPACGSVCWVPRKTPMVWGPSSAWALARTNGEPPARSTPAVGIGVRTPSSRSCHFPPLRPISRCAGPVPPLQPSSPFPSPCPSKSPSTPPAFAHPGASVVSPKWLAVCREGFFASARRRATSLPAVVGEE